MKKKRLLGWLAAGICLALLVVVLQQWGHEDLTTFVQPDDSEVTFEELLSAPYVTEGVWEFVDLWQIEVDGVTAEANMENKNLHMGIQQSLRDILRDVPLSSYIPEETVRNYDKHVKALLWETEETPALYLQLAAGRDLTNPIQEGDVSLNLLHLYSFDGIRTYLTVGYRTEPELESPTYVFYTDDPQVSADLFAFVREMTGGKQKSETEAGEEVAVKGDYPAAIMVEGVLYYLEAETPGEIDESAVIGYTTSYTDEMPQKDGETNFSRELNLPYAKVADGIAVLHQNEWWICKAK